MEDIPKTIAAMDDGSSDDTIRSNNVETHRRRHSDLSGLYEAPARARLSSTDGSLESAAQRALAESARLRLEHNRSDDTTNKITLDSLLVNDKYEHEATTHILKTLEDQLGSGQATETSVLEGISDEASKMVLEESLAAAASAEEAQSLASRSSTLEEPLMRPKAITHRARLMSVDDQLADLTGQLFENGFTMDTANMPHSDFDRNAQLVFGAPIVKPTRVFTSDRHASLESVREDLTNEMLQEDNIGNIEGVVDTENPRMSFRPNLQRTDSIRSNKSNTMRPQRSTFSDIAENVKRDVSAWTFFFRPQKATIWKYIKLMLYIVLPLVGIASLLFYFLDNPISPASGQPSVSWILLFVVRLWVTLTLGLAVQALIIDILCVGTRVIPRLLGPLLTLFIVQSKGWPFVIFVWSILNFAMLYGKSAFAAHWLFWQETFELFNDTNPSGDVVTSPLYRTILVIGIVVPIAVSVKRLTVGLFLGRQSFLHFGEQLAKVMDKMILVSQVANLARKREKDKKLLLLRQNTKAKISGDLGESKVRGYQDMLEEEEDDETSTKNSVAGLVPTERFKLAQILEHWEEPERRSAVRKKASIVAVLRFRNALALIHNDYPFSIAFGPANKRSECVESAQNIFRLLLEKGKTDAEFETIAGALAVDGKELNPVRVKSLIRVFRPNRDGTLSLLDFVKSVDAVYKEFRLLQASIENSAQIDRAFEAMFNVAFYVVVVVIVMSQLGLDPMALFLSLSSIVLGFAFMIGSATSKYFEGILFILLRRPYNIGDCICATHIESVTGLMGSIGWIVQNVTLFETTITWLPTMETATVANGALANSRMVNWARSPNARFLIFLHFPIETKYETLTLFRGALEEYMKARPREWLKFNAFRVLEIYTEKGYMKVEIRVTHRESWQNTATIYDSRGNLMSFCNEVQKLLGMQFKAPPVPIDIRAGQALEVLDTLAKDQNAIGSGYPHESSSVDGNSKGSDRQTLEQFRKSAENRHKMFF